MTDLVDYLQDKPVPPENVRAVMPDGREIPLDVAYRGLDEGTHRWVAVWRLAEMPASLKIGMLPGHTLVAVEVELA